MMSPFPQVDNAAFMSWRVATPSLSLSTQKYPGSPRGSLSVPQKPHGHRTGTFLRELSHLRDMEGGRKVFRIGYAGRKIPLSWHFWHFGWQRGRLAGQRCFAGGTEMRLWPELLPALIPPHVQGQCPAGFGHGSTGRRLHGWTPPVSISPTHHGKERGGKEGES